MAKTDFAARAWSETLVASATQTVTGSSAVITGYGAARSLRVQLNVTAASGTSPSMTVVVEDTLDGTTFNTIGTFAAKTGVSREVINVTAPFADRIRLTWTITGTTPSFTFQVDAFGQL